MKTNLILCFLLGIFLLNLPCYGQNTEDIRLNASLGQLHLIGMEKMTFVSDQYVFKRAAGGLKIDNAVSINGKVNATNYLLNGKPLLQTLNFKTESLNFGSAFQFEKGSLGLNSFKNYINRYGKLPRLHEQASSISLLQLNQKLVWQTEELALYIIELHEEVKALKQEVDHLRANP